MRGIVGGGTAILSVLSWEGYTVSANMMSFLLSRAPQIQWVPVLGVELKK